VTSYRVNVVAAAASTLVVVLHGLVTAAPASCPSAAPCAKPAAHVLLMFTRTSVTRGGALKQVWTDARGRYSTQLVPGTWTVQAVQAFKTTPGKISVAPVRSRVLNFKLVVPS
jgi:hypothetical protein